MTIQSTKHTTISATCSKIQDLLVTMGVLSADDPLPGLDVLVTHDRFCPGALFAPNKDEIATYREYLREVVQDESLDPCLVVDVLKYMYEMSRTVMTNLGSNGFDTKNYIFWSLSLRRDILGLIVSHGHRLDDDNKQAIRPLMQDIQNSLELRFAVNPVYDKGGLAVLLMSQAMAEQKDTSGVTELARKFVFDFLKNTDKRAQIAEQMETITRSLNNLGFRLADHFLERLIAKADTFCLPRDAGFAELMNAQPEIAPHRLIGHDANRLSALVNKLMDAPDIGTGLCAESLKHSRLDKASIGPDKIMGIVVCLRSLTDHAQRMMGTHETFPPDQTLAWLDQVQSSLVGCMARFCLHRSHRESGALISTMAELLDESPRLDQETALRCLVLFENDPVRLDRLLEDPAVVQLLDKDSQDLASLAIKTGAVKRSQALSFVKKWQPEINMGDIALDKFKSFQLAGSFAL